MSAQIRFILNDREITARAPFGLLVLDYLRQRARLVGTKEGCKEGDCGACVVLIGEPHGDTVHYKPVTSCLMPMAELHGKHLVTIEGLQRDGLTPVQQAIVDEGGSQCGFCTPGIVMSLTGLLLQRDVPVDEDGIKYALGGNLCRCTGYASLKRAGRQIMDLVRAEASNGSAAARNMRRLVSQGVVPEYFSSIPARLKRIPAPETVNGETPEVIIAGGTDIYVQTGERIPRANVQILNGLPGMKGITVKNGRVHIGALTTFEAFARHPEICAMIPEMPRYNLYNASWQIRNRATLGGNIINASPIADMTALLLALDTTLTLEKRGQKRTVALQRFYKGYKKLDLRPGELLTQITFPLPTGGTKINFEKVSKRKTLDIASVNSAIRIRLDDGVIADVRLTMGGVAPTPLFMQNCCDFLTGQPLSAATVEGAIAVALDEVSPISDIRGSAGYKRLLVRQLIIAHFTKLFPESLIVREFYAA